MAENKTDTTIHKHLLKVSGEADFASTYKQFKLMLEGLDKITESAAHLSRGFKQLGDAKKNFMDLTKSVAGLVGASVSLKHSLDTVIDYNKELIKLSAQFTKYGVGVTKVEQSLDSLSKQLNITRTNTMKLFSMYEKAFPYTSIVGAEKLFKNIRKVVGSNADAIADMASKLAEITSRYPDLQKHVERLNATDKETLKNKLDLLYVGKQISLSQLKGLTDYLSIRKQDSEEDKLRNKEANEYIATMEDMKRIWQDVAITVGTNIMPLFKDLGSFLKSHENSIKRIAGFITKWVIPLAALAGVVKIGSTLLGAGRGIASLGAGIGGGGLGKSVLGSFTQRGATPGNAVWVRMATIGAHGVLGAGGTGGAGDGWKSALKGIGIELLVAAAVATAIKTYDTFSDLSAAKKQGKKLTKQLGKSKETLASQLLSEKIVYGPQVEAAKEAYLNAGGAGNAPKAVEDKYQRLMRAKHAELKGKISTAVAGGATGEEAKAKVLGAKHIEAYNKKEEYFNKEKQNADMRAKAALLEQNVLMDSSTQKREEMVKLVDSYSQKVLYSGVKNEKAVTDQVTKTRDSIKDESAQIGNTIQMLEKQIDAGKRGTKNSAERNVAETKLARLKDEQADLTKVAADNEQKILDMVKEKANFYAAAADSQGQVLNSKIREMQISGKISEKTADKEYLKAEVKLDKEMVQQKERLSKAYTLVRETNEDDAHLQARREKEEADAQIAINSIIAKKLARQKEYIGLYDTQIHQSQLIAESAKLEVQLMDNLVVGLGASVNARMKSADAVRAQIETEQKALNLTNERLSMDKNNVELQNERIRRENKIKSLMIDEANILKALRDGWVSSIQAMTIGTGRIGKFKIASDQNARAGVQYLGMLRSALSGAVARPGEGNIGFKTPEQLMAGAGGLAGVAGARNEGRGYASDVGTPQYATNTAVTEQRNAATVIAGEIAKSRGKGFKSSLGYGESGAAGSATTGGTVGAGQSGMVTPGGALAPMVSTLPAATPSSVPGSNIMNINLSFSVSDVNQVVNVVSQQIRNAFKNINFGKTQ